MNIFKKERTNSEDSVLREIFFIYLEDFIKDFSFDDIYPYVNNDHLIFTEEECYRLRSLKNEKVQTVAMFFILLEKNKSLKEFVNVLKYHYQWLQEKILNGHKGYLEGNKDVLKYLNAVHELKSNFPKHSDFNVHRLNYFCLIRDLLIKLRCREYLVIYGELGFGKKWLALDSCCDYAVLNAMDFNIFWIDVHDCDSKEKDLEKLQRLKILIRETNIQRKIGDYEGISNKILELQQDLRTIFKHDDYKNSLLVLSDVQNRKTLEAFNLPCKILITTRNRKITEHLPKVYTKTVHVSEGLTQTEGFELFEKLLDKKLSIFPENANDLFEHSKGHPFLLTIIGQNLKGRRGEEWDTWINSLEDFQICNDKINNLIQISLAVLKEEDFEIYKTLVIFHHSVKIPLKVLAALWDKQERIAEKYLKKFDKYSLVTISYMKDGSMACSLHFLYYSYLQSYASIDQISLHKKLVQSYNIQQILNTRTDIDLLELPDDKYFYYYIGYHLRESQMTELFSKLYLDFGFLEQKMRATGLPNTIGDLKYFRSNITDNDNKKEKLLESLLEFLPNIEEMMFRSSDSTLLQYALMVNGILQEEALRQAKNFPNRLWFSDSDHFHRRRQIVPLQEKPKAIQLIHPDACLIAFENHTVLLADLSLGYNIEPTRFDGHEERIIHLEVFLSNYFISLDANGEIRVWSIADEKRRSVIKKRSSKLIINQINYSTLPRMRIKECLQIIKQAAGRYDSMFKSFHLETIIENKITDVILYIALSNGDIDIYKWNNNKKKFLDERIPPLKTGTTNIRFVLKVLNKFMVLNNSGSVGFFNTKDGSNGCFSFRWPPDTDTPINVHTYKNNLELNIIIVFALKILHLKLPHIQPFEFLKGDLIDLYEILDRRAVITCSAITDDNKYLIIGTKQGILVFDINEKSEVLRNSTSECINCIDVNSLDDNIFKYVIVSNSEGQKLLNIFGLRLNGNSIAWANSIGSIVNEQNLNFRFEPNAWLIGKKLFDVKVNKDVTSLIAVDSKNRVHNFTKNKWSIMGWNDLQSKISAICFRNEDYYLGCENGHIFRSYDDQIETSLSSEITFMQYLSNGFLIVSTKNECLIKNDNETFKMTTEIVKCFTLNPDCIILVNRKSTFYIVGTGEDQNKKFIFCDEFYGGCAMKSNYIVIGTWSSKIYAFNIIQSEKIEFQQQQKLSTHSNDVITCVALTSDASICAAGLRKGSIEIYKTLEQWILVQTLESHIFTIYDLKFSPWNDTFYPIILVSVSEQICLWNISHILNNPLDKQNGNMRHSSRFNSRKNFLNGNTSNKNTNIPINKIFEKNIWSNKKGSTDKPELLSCIKFAGNKAEQIFTNENFTKFITIDDEGEIYNLKINDIINNEENKNYYSSNYNGIE